MNKLLEELLAESPDRDNLAPFTPFALYNRCGDLIDVVLKDCSYYAKWLNPQVTTLHAQRDTAFAKKDEIVGVQIWALDVDGKNHSVKSVVCPEAACAIQ